MEPPTALRPPPSSNPAPGAAARPGSFSAGPEDSRAERAWWRRLRPTLPAGGLRRGVPPHLVIPLGALRWLLRRSLRGDKAPTDLVLRAQPPSLFLAATVTVMGQRLRVSASILIEEVVGGADELRLVLRVRELRIIADDPQGPLGRLLTSVSLSKPASLVGLLGPMKPKAIVGASGDRFEIDLLKIPALAENRRLRTSLRALTPVLGIAEVWTFADLLVFTLRLTPRGLPAALAGLRGAPGG